MYNARVSYTIHVAELIK